MSRTERFPPLSVEADLTVSVAGNEYRVTDRDDRLVVSAPSLPAAVQLLRSLPESDAPGRLLLRSDLAVDVEVRDAVVASTGAGVEPGPLTGWIGGAPVAPDPAGVASASAGELRARPATVLALVAAGLLLVWLLARGDDAAPDG